MPAQSTQSHSQDLWIRFFLLLTAALGDAMAKQGVGRAMQNRHEFPANTPAIILADDFNPIDLRDLWMKEEVRRNIPNTTDPDFCWVKDVVSPVNYM